MLYYKFKNYEEFKELFGITKHANGTTSRKNRILLSFIKNRGLLHDAAVSGDYSMLHISDITTMKNIITEKIIESGDNDRSLPYRLELIGKKYHSSVYETDNCKGLCEDGDAKAVRYISHDKGNRIFKKKAGKLYRAIILETDYGRTLPETVLNFMCEEFAAEWQAYAMRKQPATRLYVGKDFERIYSSKFCDGDFGSCMTDKEQYSFYEDAVDADAAYLENKEGMIVARCIIYNRAVDQDGKVWRLAERQYSTDSNDILKRALVDALIEGKYIDGYKKVGASCNEPNAFVDTEGNSLSDRRFAIECELEWGDTTSYQDSFKWYDIRKKKACNYGCGDLDLSVTEETLEDPDDEYDEYDEYDGYHQYYCRETTSVYVDGRELSCNVNSLEDFIWVESEEEYHHKDDVQICPECGEYLVAARGSYSDMTEETYCNNECRDKAECRYKKDNWFYSSYDMEYYESESDVVSYHKWDSGTGRYVERTISELSAEELVGKGELIRLGDDLFDIVDECSNLPFGYKLIRSAV